MEHTTTVAVKLLTEVYSCITAAKRHKLPSAVQASIWSAFHLVRCSKPVTQAWSNFTHHFPPQYLGEKNLALQVMLDRILKKIIRNEAEARHHMHARTRSEFLKPLTATESNAIRYMAGYVAVKLLKKAKKNTKNPDSRKKRHLFINVLEKMKAEQQPGLPCTLSDYSSQWSELIDRGRLYHVNEDVYNLIESIEMIVRQELQTTNYAAEENLYSLISELVLSDQAILRCWEGIADSIPIKYEQYSIELLKDIAHLWVTIRGFSFAKTWTMQFEVNKYKKGTRKTLKPETKDT